MTPVVAPLGAALAAAVAAPPVARKPGVNARYCHGSVAAATSSGHHCNGTSRPAHDRVGVRGHAALRVFVDANDRCEKGQTLAVIDRSSSDAPCAKAKHRSTRTRRPFAGACDPRGSACSGSEGARNRRRKGRFAEDLKSAWPPPIAARPRGGAMANAASPGPLPPPRRASSVARRSSPR